MPYRTSCRQFTDPVWIIVASLSGLFTTGCWQSPPTSSAVGVKAAPIAVCRSQTEPPVGPEFESHRLPVPRLVDVARSGGIEFSFFTDAVPGRFLLPEVMGGGAGWLDYDGDGRLDLYVRDGCQIVTPDATPPRHVSRLFRNLGNSQFEDVTLAAACAFRGYGQGCAAGDFNVDGCPDLYLTNYGANALYRNNGDGTFTDTTESAGVGVAGWSTSAIWLDLDDDRNLDLYVVRYMDVTSANSRVCEYDQKPGYCGPGSYASVPDVVYLGRGDGTFIEAENELGFHDQDGKGLAIVAADFDEDLHAEIYVANDMTPKHLFTRSRVHNGDRTSRSLYENVGVAAGCALSEVGMNEAGMGIACADFDGDGLPDIFLTHYYHMKNTLYHNRGGLVFDDDSRRSRIAAASFESLGFGNWAFDYDRDGDPDLLISNGHVLGPEQSPNQMRPQLLQNTRGVFSDISDSAGDYFAEFCLGRCVAAADFDDDGRLDFAVTHLDRPLALLANQTESNRRFIGFQLQTPSRIPPVGGRIVVACGALRQVLPVTAGGSYLAASDTRFLAGLGDENGPVTVEIHWPSGRIDRVDDLQTGRYWRVMEGRRPEPLGSSPVP